MCVLPPRRNRITNQRSSRRFSLHPAFHNRVTHLWEIHLCMILAQVSLAPLRLRPATPAAELRGLSAHFSRTVCSLYSQRAS